MIKITQSQLDRPKIDRVYEDFIATKVVTDLKRFFGKQTNYTTHISPNVRHAFYTAVSFLSAHSLDSRHYDDDTLKANVMKYLLGGDKHPQQYLEGIIRSFWRCAADLFVDRLNTATSGSSLPYLDDLAVEALSKWPAFKEKVRSQRKQAERHTLLLSVLNQNTIRLFSNVTNADIYEWSLGIREITNDEIEAIILHPDLAETVYGRIDSENKPVKDHPGALRMLETVFNYNDTNRELVAGTPRHQLMSAIHVPVCPYCNRQYITLYSEQKGKKKKSTKKTTADLDHFYIKSQYPYLSLSLFNFIPSCQICNSRFKGTTDFYLYPHVYPYEAEFGDGAKFALKLDASLMDDKANWDRMIELSDGSGNDAVRNSISTFMLEQVYQSHGDYVHDIWAKSKAYSKEKIDSLKEEYGDLLGDNRSIMDLIYGQYLNQSQMYLRPLSKLTKDILEECYDGEIDWENL